MTNQPKSYLQIYKDDYALWTQLIGCIGIFGSFFVVMFEGIENGMPWFSIGMFFVGAIICTINMGVDN